VGTAGQVHLQVAGTCGIQFGHELGLAGGHVQHPAGAFVVLDERQGAQQHRSDLANGVLVRLAAQTADGLFHREHGTVHHGVEQIGLVLEVPVHRASGHAGRLRHVLQRGPRDALECKQVLGRINQCGAGLLCIFFGSAHAGSKCQVPR